MRKVFFFLAVLVPAAAYAICDCESVRPCQEETVATAAVTQPSYSFSDTQDDSVLDAFVIAFVLLPVIIAIRRMIRLRNPLLLLRIERQEMQDVVDELPRVFAVA